MKLEVGYLAYNQSDAGKWGTSLYTPNIRTESCRHELFSQTPLF